MWADLFHEVPPGTANITSWVCACVCLARMGRSQIRVAGEEYMVTPSAKNPLLPARIPLNKPVPGVARGGLDAYAGCIGDVSVTSDVRAVLLAEMLARTAKSMIREYLRIAARSAKVTSVLANGKQVFHLT